MSFKDLTSVQYDSVNEEILQVIRARTNNTDSDLYFRVLGAYFMSQAASNMRAKVKTPHRGILPCNMYALLLAESGAGKGHSMNVLEDEIFNTFTEVFLKETMPTVAQLNMEKAAIHRCNLSRNNLDFDSELSKLQTEFDSCGEFPYTFDSGTGPAYRQARTAAQISDIGALSFVCDEIGTNLLNNAEIFAVNLEAYDVGKIKQKLIKNTAENKRSETRHTPVPSNMLCFGTPFRLFNGGREEIEMSSLFETGYARRFMFGTGGKVAIDENLTGAELIKLLTANNVDQNVVKLNRLFKNLADISNYDRVIEMPLNVAEINADYQLMCERKAAKLSQYEATRKAELAHRYFRAIKLACVYAWADGSLMMTEDHMYSAIKLVEDSGSAFNQILTRPKNYARLAQYIAEVPEEVTHADIIQDLAYYPTAKNKQEELLSLATSWGYKNNIIIKRSLEDGIEFFKGESLKETNINELIISYGTHDAYGYINKPLKWEQLHQLCQANGYHWVAHYLEGGFNSPAAGHRSDDTVISGFNLICIDVDDGVSLATAKSLMVGTKAYFYTTKRHNALVDGVQYGERFRIVLPLKYELKMSKKDYKDFMNNVLESLPFGSDNCSNQRSKKWLANNGIGEYTEGEMFNPLPFIPKTQKNTERQAENKKLSNLGKIEMYFAKQWSSGRNNTLLNYGMMLMDSGEILHDAIVKVRAFNDSFSDSLGHDELNTTVFVTMSARSGK